MVSQLESLPGEIQDSIYRLLDPIGLISLSQASSRLRRTIQPTKTHFVERLLALECLPEFGGPPYVFHPRGNKVDPDFDQPEWDSIRLACSGCLRLLHHINFTHQYIARRGFRKPIPGSPAEELITSWEPSLRGNNWGKRHWQHRIQSGLAAKEREVLEQYRMALTGHRTARSGALDFEMRLLRFRDSGMESFQDMTIDEFQNLSDEEERELLDKEAHAIELQTCGYDRRLRKCNECRYQAKEQPWRWNHGRYIFTWRIPVLHKCRLPYRLESDRWFPGFLDKIHNHHPNRVVGDILKDRKEELSSIYSARCPCCQRWQEGRALHLCSKATADIIEAQGETDRKGKPLWTQDSKGIDVKTIRCNDCILKQDGREELQRALTEWMRAILHSQMKQVQQAVLDGLPIEVVNNRFPKRFRQTGRGEIGGTYRDAGLVRTWDRAEMMLLCSWHQHLENLEHNGELQIFLKDHLAREWSTKNIGKFKEDIEFWNWLKDCDEKIEENPKCLLEWALSRSGASVA